MSIGELGGVFFLVFLGIGLLCLLVAALPGDGR